MSDLDDEGRPKRPGWTCGKDRGGGVRTIYRDGESVGQMLSGDAIELTHALATLGDLVALGISHKVVADHFGRVFGKWPGEETDEVLAAALKDDE